LWCFNGYTRFISFALAVGFFAAGDKHQYAEMGVGRLRIVAVMAGIVLNQDHPATGKYPGMFMRVLQTVKPICVN